MKLIDFLKKINLNKKFFLTILIIIILFLFVNFFTTGELAPLGYRII